MDGLRFTFLLECAEHMRRATDRFRDASRDQDTQAARIHFDLMAEIGKSIRDTLEEIEAGAKKEAA